MAGPNTTGLPRTEDYNLGRGIVYFATLGSDGKPDAYRDMGNAPEFNVSIEVETLEHQSSRQGLKVTDKEVIISQKVNLSLVLDEINHENLALLLSGEKGTHTNVAVAGFTEYEMVVGDESATTELALGRWYDIVNSAGERAYDVDGTKLSIATTNLTPVPLVEGTDYTLDAAMGRIFILSTSTVAATAIAGFEGLDVTLTADAGALGVNEVRALTTTSVSGALKFIAENPANNDVQTEFQFHQVSLKADGDFSLIGDEFSTMNFTGVAESNVLADADSPTLTIRNTASA